MTGRMLRSLVAATLLLVVAVGCAGSDPIEVAGEVGRPVRIDYGEHPDAFGELWLPPRAQEVPVVVLIHGGFWRDGFSLDLMDPLVPTLLQQGYAVWNIEYRRVGARGGYPETFEDVADAVDHLARLVDSRLDLTRVAVVGHSAGGQLAAWAAARSSIPDGAVGADPQVRPVVAISQAGVLDLVGCVQQGIGGTACLDLLGTALDDDAEVYAETSPTEMVPFDATVVAIHGELDRIVPSSQSVTFVDGARAVEMDASYVPIRDGDHFSNLDPQHAAWIAVLDALGTTL